MRHQQKTWNEIETKERRKPGSQYSKLIGCRGTTSAPDPLVERESRRRNKDWDERAVTFWGGKEREAAGLATSSRSVYQLGGGRERWRKEERRRTRIRWERRGERSGNRKDREAATGTAAAAGIVCKRKEKAGICSHRAINEGMNVQTSTSQRSFIDQI